MTRPDAAALTPVLAWMQAAATARAGQIRASAREEAARIATAGQAEAAAVLRQARAAARAEAAPLAADALGRSRLAARTIVLSAQRQAYEELRGQVRAAVTALTAEPGYDQLAGTLRQLASRAAGSGATVTAAPSGGFVARSPGRIVDCSLARLADLAVDALGPEVQDLWNS